MASVEEYYPYFRDSRGRWRDLKGRFASRKKATRFYRRIRIEPALTGKTPRAKPTVIERDRLSIKRVPVTNPKTGQPIKGIPRDKIKTVVYITFDIKDYNGEEGNDFPLDMTLSRKSYLSRENVVKLMDKFTNEARQRLDFDQEGNPREGFQRATILPRPRVTVKYYLK